MALAALLAALTVGLDGDADATDGADIFASAGGAAAAGEFKARASDDPRWPVVVVTSRSRRDSSVTRGTTAPDAPTALATRSISAIFASFFAGESFG